MAPVNPDKRLYCPWERSPLLRASAMDDLKTLHAHLESSADSTKWGPLNSNSSTGCYGQKRLREWATNVASGPLPASMTVHAVRLRGARKMLLRLPKAQAPHSHAFQSTKPV